MEDGYSENGAEDYSNVKLAFPGRGSDAAYMQTPSQRSPGPGSIASATQLIEQQQRMRLGDVYQDYSNLKEPMSHSQYFPETRADAKKAEYAADAPLPLKMPFIYEEHKAQSALEKQSGYDPKTMRQYKEPVPSFLPDEEKYMKFTNVLQPDEKDLKAQVERNRT